MTAPAPLQARMFSAALRRAGRRPVSRMEPAEFPAARLRQAAMLRGPLARYVAAWPPPGAR